MDHIFKLLSDLCNILITIIKICKKCVKKIRHKPEENLKNSLSFSEWSCTINANLFVYYTPEYPNCVTFLNQHIYNHYNHFCKKNIPTKNIHLCFKLLVSTKTFFLLLTCFSTHRLTGFSP